MADKNIESQLKELSTNELIELQKSITRILDGRDVGEDVIKDAINYFYSIGIYGPRYTQVTLYLEKQGLRREAIARRIIDMWRKDPFMAQGGCPIGEQESPENPIYPYIDETKYHHICYLQRR